MHMFTLYPDGDWVSYAESWRLSLKGSGWIQEAHSWKLKLENWIFTSHQQNHMYYCTHYVCAYASCDLLRLQLTSTKRLPCECTTTNGQHLQMLFHTHPSHTKRLIALHLFNHRKLKRAKEHVQSTEAWGYNVHVYSLRLVKGTDVECHNM